MLYQGPCLLPELLKILLRFRCRKYAFVAEVQQAFLQIEEAEADRDFLRTLWVTNFDPLHPSHYELCELRFTRCVFGVTSSQFHPLATFRHHLSQYQASFPEVAQEVISSMYVDDLVTGADTPQNAHRLFSTAKAM